MSTRMLQRKGTATQWFDADPILNAGEIGYETDTGKFKFGNGSTHWNDLLYFIDEGQVTIMTNSFATESYVDTAVGNVTIDLSTAAGTNIDWNSGSSQFDLNASTTDITEGTNLYFTNERAQDAVGNSVGTGLSYNDASGSIGIDNAALTNFLLEGASGASYGLIGTSTYLDVKNTNGYNKEIELDITAVESKLDTDGYAKQSHISTAIDNLIASAPGALNTLNELAEAINNDASYAATITTALGLKAPLESPTFTGTVSGITKSMIGLGNVDNTSDASKPVSTATQTALDLKENALVTVNQTAKTAGYTFNISDANTLIQMNGAYAFTVPLNSSVTYPVGTKINLLALTTGVSVSFTSGITSYATPGTKLRATGSMATLIKLASDTWVLTGDLIA